MGHNVVPNDTPEKARARQELFALLNDPAFDLSKDPNDPKNFSKIVAKALEGGLTKDRLCVVADMDDPDDFGRWALGGLIPDLPMQKGIVVGIHGELARFETAAGYD